MSHDSSQRSDLLQGHGRFQPSQAFTRQAHNLAQSDLHSKAMATHQEQQQLADTWPGKPPGLKQTAAGQTSEPQQSPSAASSSTEADFCQLEVAPWHGARRGIPGHTRSRSSHASSQASLRRHSHSSAGSSMDCSAPQLAVPR